MTIGLIVALIVVLASVSWYAYTNAKAAKKYEDELIKKARKGNNVTK